jgi:hypothetical protein
MSLKKNEKKISSADKKLLEFLIEDYLELDPHVLLARINTKEKIEDYWEKLLPFLERDTYWKEYPDQEEIDNSNKPQVILSRHILLKPLWDQFKEHLVYHRDIFIPERNKSRKNKELIKQTKSEDLSQFKDLVEVSYDPYDDDKSYKITLKIRVSFELGSIFFIKSNISIITTFYTLLSKANTTLFSNCNYCEKFIIITRSNKQHCSRLCAAKKNQKEKWKESPEEMSQKERQRYQKRKQLK